MREPESQEWFDASFSTAGLTGVECMERANKLLGECQQEAAGLAARWLLERGHFNGNVENSVYHYPGVKQCNVQVVLTCYGLPLRLDPPGAWRPIETAPKDGTSVLVYVPLTEDTRWLLPPTGMVSARYVNDLAGWTTRGVGGLSPTHWMPLPPPPGAAPPASPPPRAEQWEDHPRETDDVATLVREMEQRLPTTHHDMPADRDPETPIMETMIPRPSGDGGAP
jgi:hypothetical protein